jgi:hypothetical protein
MEKELMKNIKSLIVIVGFLAMCSCAANPMKNLNAEGELYFQDRDIKYKNVLLTLNSHNESKSIESGYMSNETTKNYVNNSLTKNMRAQNLIAEEGIDVSIDLNVKRIYSWGGSSMAVLNYTANVQLLESGRELGKYRLQGDIKDGSILGDHKAMLGLNNADDEGNYLDTVVGSIILSLPKGKLSK